MSGSKQWALDGQAAALRPSAETMRRTNRALAWRWLLAFVLAAAPAAALGQGPAGYAEIMERAVRAGLPGVQAVVIQGGGEWSGAAGLASVERGEAMTLQHRIRLASVTKMMTYATIIELVRQGRLALSDRAVDRLPPGTLANIPNADRVTIAHLLEHRSGIYNFTNGADFGDAVYADPNRASRIWTAPELIAFAARPDHLPANLPGEGQNYSSTGYLILEMIAERVASESLPRLYERFFFRPLGMTATGVEGHDFTTADIVDSYGRRPDGTRRVSAFAGRLPVRGDDLINLSSGLSYYNAWARGAGAAASTACDLARFMRAVRDNRVIVLNDQAQTFASALARGTGSFNWNGGSAGIQSSIFYAPAGEIIVNVLTNGTNAGPTSVELARSLLEAARGRAASAAPPLSSPCPAPSTHLHTLQEVARDYERVFRTGDAAAFQRAFLPGGVYLALPRMPHLPMGLQPFPAAFEGWAREPDPLASVTVDEIGIVGERMASMRLRLHYRGRVYLDQLSLYRFGGRWMIVAKQSQPVSN